jgi:hypothetical protein
MFRLFEPTNTTWKWIFPKGNHYHFLALDILTVPAVFSLPLLKSFLHCLCKNA